MAENDTKSRMNICKYCNISVHNRATCVTKKNNEKDLSGGAVSSSEEPVPNRFCSFKKTAEKLEETGEEATKLVNDATGSSSATDLVSTISQIVFLFIMRAFSKFAPMRILMPLPSSKA